MKTILTITMVLAGAACASGPAPTSQIASATAAVRGAEEAGSLGVPQAALHVKLAEEQVERAQSLAENEKHDRARAFAVRAYQDAELAIALAREDQARRELEMFANNHSAAAQPDTAQPPSAAGE